MRLLAKSNLVKLGLVALTALGTAQAVYAADDDSAVNASPEQQAAKMIENRQALFKVINYNSDLYYSMLKNKIPFDAPTVAKAAGRIEVLAAMIPDMFATDTRKVTGTKTRAREGIWTNAADYKAKSDELVKAAQQLGAAAKSGDKAATYKVARVLGNACSGCHDNYRDK
jgi:cytochrome c556